MRRSNSKGLHMPGPLSRDRRLLMKSGLVVLMPALSWAESVSGWSPHQELEVWLKGHLPRVVKALRATASEARLNRLETVIGAALPEDYRTLYRWHNGQTEKVFAGPWPGLRFMPLDLVEKEWKFWAHLLDGETAEGRASYDEMAVSVRPGTIKEKYVNPRWIPFADGGGGNFLGIDLDPGPNGSYGQVINFGRDQDLKRVVAPNIGAFVDWVLGLLRAGNFYVEDTDDGEIEFGLATPRTGDFLWAIRTLLKQPWDLDHRSRLHCPA